MARSFPNANVRPLMEVDEDSGAHGFLTLRSFLNSINITGLYSLRQLPLHHFGFPNTAETDFTKYHFPAEYLERARWTTVAMLEI